MAKETKGATNELNYIVGIGASAGGLEAIQTLLSALPANTGFPFIIVQHLSPDYKSLLCEILSRSTSMPVLQAEEDMEIEPDHVYIIQPGKNLEINGGKLHLSAQKGRELNLPIDLFFRSLAAEAGSHAIAIVLSGTGSDGTNGLKVIKENDGMTLVQDLDTAKFDGMPRSAMRTGLVDAQMSPEMIAAEISHIASAILTRDKLAKALEEEANDELLKKVYIILKKVCNINFSHYKTATILRRLERRMMITHKETLADYVELLYQTPEEAKTLSKEVLIGVTSFFRDPEYFEVLKETAVKNIIINGKPDETIRVWVAGCSTGEEAYSIAILFCEEMEALKVKRPVKIFATDLDAESIDTAGKGVYGSSIVESVSVTRLSKYFTLTNNAYTIKRDISEE